MGIDDVNTTVNAVMWMALGLNALVPILAWKAPTTGKRARLIIALVLGALCWVYNVGLLLGGTQPVTYAAGLGGLGLLLLGAFRLGKARECVGSSAAGVWPQAMLVVTVWSVAAMALFAASGFDGR